MTDRHHLNYIVTSDEVTITRPVGTRPMDPALAKKLYLQNTILFLSEYKIKTPSDSGLSIGVPTLKDITATITTIEKYTIVELTHNNKHYHGLSSLAHCDDYDAIVGIAVAYNRAFKEMVGAINGVLKSETPEPTIQAVVDLMKHTITEPPLFTHPMWSIQVDPGERGIFTKITSNDNGYKKRIENINKQIKVDAKKQSTEHDIDFNIIYKEAVANASNHMWFEQDIETVIEVDATKQEQAVIDLIKCAGINTSLYNLKSKAGVNKAHNKLKRFGYTIDRLEYITKPIVKYVLKKNGDTIKSIEVKTGLRGTNPPEIITDDDNDWLYTVKKAMGGEEPK